MNGGWVGFVGCWVVCWKFEGVGWFRGSNSNEGNLVCHNPRMRRNKNGRPVSTHISIEMDTTDNLNKKCSLCRLPGHNRKHCPNVGSSNT